MKKLKALLVLFIMLTVAGTASAQDPLLVNPNNRPYFGVRLNYDLNAADGHKMDDAFHNGSGFSAGMIFNVPLYMNLYFEPGLSIFYNTIGRTDFSNSQYVNGDIVKDGVYRDFGLRIPINVGYHFDFTELVRVFVFTGPQINVNLVAQSKFKDEHEHSLFKDGYKHSDVQWMFGAGVNIHRLILSIGGGVGMSNLMDGKQHGNHPSEKFRRNTFTVSLGYNF